MKRFLFPLDSVLRLREQQTEAEEAALANLHQQLQAIHERQGSFEEEVEAAERSATPHGGEVSTWALVQLAQYRRFAAAERHRLAQEATQCLEVIDRQRAKLIEAKRSVELLVKLKEKARKRWEQDQARDEQAVAEEVFFSQWKRGS